LEDDEAEAEAEAEAEEQASKKKNLEATDADTGRTGRNAASITSHSYNDQRTEKVLFSPPWNQKTRKARGRMEEGTDTANRLGKDDGRGHETLAEAAADGDDDDDDDGGRRHGGGNAKRRL
jgi:hypothetical protein